MRRLALVVALVGCSSHAATTPPQNPPGDPTGDPPADPPADTTCAGEPCEAPAQCLTVVGMQPDSAHEECWIPCGDDETCPAGLTCTMMYDGPGHVCVKPE